MPTSATAQPTCCTSDPAPEQGTSEPQPTTAPCCGTAQAAAADDACCAPAAKDQARAAGATCC